MLGFRVPDLKGQCRGNGKGSGNYYEGIRVQGLGFWVWGNGNRR